MRKKFILSAIITVVLSMQVFGQRDTFFSDWIDDNNERIDNNIEMPNLPNAHGSSDDQAPVGSGTIILLALAAGYALGKRLFILCPGKIAINSDAKVKKADKKMRTIAGRLLGELSRLLTVEILSCLFVHSLMLSTVSLIPNPQLPCLSSPLTVSTA